LDSRIDGLLPRERKDKGLQGYSAEVLKSAQIRQELRRSAERVQQLLASEGHRVPARPGAAPEQQD